jgi:hypothetical protein
MCSAFLAAPSFLPFFLSFVPFLPFSSFLYFFPLLSISFLSILSFSSFLSFFFFSPVCAGDVVMDDASRGDDGEHILLARLRLAHEK